MFDVYVYVWCICIWYAYVYVHIVYVSLPPVDVVGGGVKHGRGEGGCEEGH